MQWQRGDVAGHSIMTQAGAVACECPGGSRLGHRSCRDDARNTAGKQRALFA